MVLLADRATERLFNEDGTIKGDLTFRSAGLGMWYDRNFDDLMLHVCNCLYDLRDSICRVLSINRRDWSDSTASLETESNNLAIAEALVVAEHWLSREGFMTDIEQGGSKVQPLAAGIRRMLFADAFNNLQRHCDGSRAELAAFKAGAKAA